MKYQSKDLRQFPEQIRFSVANYKSPGFDLGGFDNILLCGLGGSGIAGRIIKSYFFDKCPLPVEVVSDYTLPNYTSTRTLAIMCSYSGNTEETLSMYDAAKAKGATIIVIATGGKLAEKAGHDGYTFYQAQTGFQPRMALGYSLTFLLLLFSEFSGLQNTVSELSVAASSLDDEQKFMDRALKLFDAFENMLPAKVVVVTDYFTNPIGLRFCQQLQENAKHEAFLHELPESNHNVVESYYGKLDSVFIFINSKIQPRTNLRFKFLKGVLEENGNIVHEVNLNGPGISDALECIYTLDWVSLLVADHKGLNSTLIKNINALKDYLSAN